MLYTIIDFETTGLKYLEHQIIEVGAIKVNDNFEEVGRLHTMVKLTEGNTISQFITDLTGITEADTYTGVSEVSALMILKEFIGNSVVVAQNAPFDLGFLAKAFEPELFICTRTLSLLLHPEEPANLKAIAARYNIEFNHHRSINDCEATLEAFKIMMKEVGEQGLPHMNLVLATPERPLLFTPLAAIVIDHEHYKKSVGETKETKETEETKAEKVAEIDEIEATEPIK